MYQHLHFFSSPSEAHFPEPVTNDQPYLPPTALPLSRSDWKPDSISLACGQFMSPVNNRQADISHYRLAAAWELTEPLWTSTNLVLQGYAELANGPAI